MKISAEWLAEHIEGGISTQQLAEALERAGVEVEGIDYGTTLDDGVVVGRVVDCRPHPNAEKLKVCTVDVGAGQQLEIVCGAPNVAASLTVAVALVGAKLADGIEIKTAHLRGVESQGMVCSAAELGWGSDHSGIMELPPAYEAGKSLSHYLQQNDVIDLTTSANRWDLQSVIGLAREAAAHSNKKIKLMPKGAATELASGALMAHIEQGIDVKRFMLARLRVDNTKATPDWMSRRLQASGVRSISLIVDITNYVMLECGQPLHAFDANTLELPLNVRSAHQQEAFETLDGSKRQLDMADIVIADTNGPISLAGVMGGRNSEVSEKTTEIILEAATFPASTMRKSAQRYNLRTDASARFERGLPTEVASQALHRAISLIADLAGGVMVESIFDTQPEPLVNHSLEVLPDRVSELLGVKVGAQSMASDLAKLGFGTEQLAGGELNITVPWWRPDITVQADIAEEVMRMVGYDELPATLPIWRPRQVAFDQRWPLLWRVKSLMRALGLFEVVTYSFISEQQVGDSGVSADKHLKLQNPKSVDQAYLRINMMPSLLSAVARNRHYADQFGMFEVSKVYAKAGEGELPHESTHLAVMVYGRSDMYRRVKHALDTVQRELGVESLTLVKADPTMYDQIHPNHTAEIQLAGSQIGIVSELHPALAKKYKLKGSVGYLEFDLDKFITASAPKQYREVSKFPGTSRDVSIVLKDAILWQDISAALTGAGIRHHFISEYYGSDLPTQHKNLAIRLEFTAPDKTLTEAEAEVGQERAMAVLIEKFGAKLRS